MDGGRGRLCQGLVAATEASVRALKRRSWARETTEFAIPAWERCSWARNARNSSIRALKRPSWARERTKTAVLARKRPSWARKSLLNLHLCELPRFAGEPGYAVTSQALSVQGLHLSLRS